MSEAVTGLLVQLEAELKQQQLWSSAAPDSKALASKMPFCCDTLPLQHWLQFIFIPRLRALLAAEQRLPAKVSVLPYAEQVFRPQGEHRVPLLQLIERIDIIMSGDA